eukprot:2025099-Pyramimonas_sp.AAC.1
MTGAARHLDEQDAHSSLATNQVFQEWQIAPSAIELLVRRLSWWQSIVQNPSHHGWFLATFFGRCRFKQQAAISHRPVSASTFNEQDGISAAPSVHPWAKQLADDP